MFGYLKKLVRTSPTQGYIGPPPELPELPELFNQLKFGAHALSKLIRDCSFETALDVGSGAGAHSKIMADAGKTVTAIDFGTSVYAAEHPAGVEFVTGNYLTHKFGKQFDLVWACHVLEHQPNPNIFLQKVLSDTAEGGLIAITVPPARPKRIAGGHVTMWNAGLLLYQLVLAGNNCQGAAILCYGYNISLIVQRIPIRQLPELTYDSGDIEKLLKYFPPGLSEPFDGDISEFNWDCFCG
jgi:SAM-dependent methyltransferase